MIRRAATAVLRAGARSVLTMAGIAVGVFAVVLISAAGSTGKIKITQTLESMGINSVLVAPEEGSTRVTLTKLDAENLSRLSGVYKAMPVMMSVTDVELLGQSTDCYAWGINSDARELISLEPLHGRLITAGDTASGAAVCVIDEAIAKKVYGRSNIVGKTARIILGGAYREFEIVGVARSGITSLQSVLSGIVPSFVYVPCSTMQCLTGRTSYDRMAVLTESDDADGLAERITETICERCGTEDGVAVIDMLQQKSKLEGVISTIGIVLSLIAGISLAVSGLTVMTTMLVSVGERRREIGIRKSIGAKNSAIMLEFLAESAMLSLLGSLAGAAIGLSVYAGGCLLLTLPFAPDFAMLAVAVGVSLLMGVLFGVYPAVKAAKMDPVDALRI